jgi:hypothetical protein
MTPNALREKAEWAVLIKADKTAHKTVENTGERRREFFYEVKE